MWPFPEHNQIDLQRLTQADVSLSYLRVDAWDPGALAAAAVVDEALVDVVAIEAVPGPADGAVTALMDDGKVSIQTVEFRFC